MTSMVNAVVIGPVTAPTKEVMMGELRDRMVRDMELRNYALRTIESYVADVKGLARYYKRRPDKLTDQEVQRYLLHLREERKLSVSTYNQVHCALRFLHETTLGRPQAALTVPRPRGEQKLPEILSPAEVGAIRLQERGTLLRYSDSVVEPVATSVGALATEGRVGRVERMSGVSEQQWPS